jgi:hypothetical protein
MRAAAFLLALPVAFTGAANAATDNPIMTIEIFNNSATYNIYPVLSTGRSDPDEWLQSAFQVPVSKLKDNPYPRGHQFRLYINPTGNGIPPGGHITVTLPLFTQLVPGGQVDPTKIDQYIDWWPGGRVEIYDAPASEHKPPEALTANYERRGAQAVVTPIKTAVLPTCKPCQKLTIFKDPAGLKGNEPSQLIEYTLGAIDTTKDPYQLNDHNVDYDVSYVDSAYLPAAMEPFGNEMIGYVGTPITIAKFKQALNKFVAPTSPYAGWPQFIDDQKEIILKVPSALHAIAGDPDLTPKPWPPLIKMQDFWENCTKAGSKSTLPICTPMRDVRKMFAANYTNYKNNFAALGCDTKKSPLPLTNDLMFAHVHGWAPFNENCPSSRTNLLEQTPAYKADNFLKYREVKEEFDKLQYWPNGAFNPYSLLIHGENYINTPYVYAYSVDDAVGNMQVEGKGLIIAVGGTHGLPNPDHATKPIHVNMGYDSKDKIRITNYGVCSNTPDHPVNPNHPSFDISIANLETCVLTLIDNQKQLYRFKLKSSPPFPLENGLTPATHAPIDCSISPDQKSKEWCGNVFAQSVREDVHNVASFVITPAPQQPPK